MKEPMTKQKTINPMTLDFPSIYDKAENPAYTQIPVEFFRLLPKLGLKPLHEKVIYTLLTFRDFGSETTIIKVTTETLIHRAGIWKSQLYDVLKNETFLRYVKVTRGRKCGPGDPGQCTTYDLTSLYAALAKLRTPINADPRVEAEITPAPVAAETIEPTPEPPPALKPATKPVATKAESDCWYCRLQAQHPELDPCVYHGPVGPSKATVAAIHSKIDANETASDAWLKTCLKCGKKGDSKGNGVVMLPDGKCGACHTFRSDKQPKWDYT